MALEINPEDINRYLANAILDSAIGTALREMIDKKVKELGQSYNNPVEPVINQAILTIVKDIVNVEFRPQIEAKVREKMTDDLLGKLVDAAWDNLYRQITR